MNMHLYALPAAVISLLASAGPDLTGTDLEHWTRLGIAGVSVGGLIYLATRTMPGREREKDKSHHDNLVEVLKSSEEKMKIFSTTCLNANDKVCVQIAQLQTAVETGSKEHTQLLREHLLSSRQPS